LEQIPLPLLYSISRLPSSLTGATNPLLLRTRDFKTYEVVFRKEDEAEAVYSSVKALCSAVGVGGVASGFAFCYQGDDCAVKEGDTTKDKGKGRGWEMYDVDKEFARMGVGSRSLAWRISPVNADYTVGSLHLDTM
jgi:myotubularin-related protein 6/7/8